MRLMTVTGSRLAAAVAGLFAIGLLAPAAAQGPTLAMLNSLERGQWEVRYRDGGETRRVCLRSGHEFIQLQHRETGCGRFIVDDGASAVTVQYTCRGNGYGRTSIRRESPTLVQIESQGIAGGLPFEFSAEARRTGACR